MNDQEYLQRFFEEKDLPAEVFQIEHKGYTHFVESEVIIDSILHASPEEQHEIRKVLMKIDMQNGDVMDFLRHLATGYVQS